MIVHYIGKFITRILLLTFLLSILSSCTSNSQLQDNPQHDPPALSKYTLRTKNTINYFATASSLGVYDDFSIPTNMSKYDAFWEELKDEMEQIENKVSLSVETSDISRFNKLNYGERMSISNHTANILKIAKKAYEASDGLYDPTVYPLVDLWAFTPRFNEQDYRSEYPYDREKAENGTSLPDEVYIAEFTKIADFKNIILSGDEESGYTLTKNIEPVTIDGTTYQAKLDLGGIAKGYAVDIVMDKLKNRKYNYGYFSSGTSSIGFLKSASKKSIENETFRYDLEIRNPRPGDTESSSFMSVALNDLKISSSGDYDHSYKIDDTIYSHIIDANTGYPMNALYDGDYQKGIATVTILGENAAMCDAISTAICLMDLDEALEYVNNEKFNYEIIIVLYNSAYDYYEVLTSLDSDEYFIHDNAYRLASVINSDGNITYSGTLFK